MTSASLFEQLTGSVSLPMVSIVSGITLALIFISTVAFRFFFTSSTKSKSTLSSKQISNKEKKTNVKKQQTETATSSNKKKNNNNKTKKNAIPPAEPISSSTITSSSLSEESEDEKVMVVASSKKQPLTSNKAATSKSFNTSDENSKSTNGIKTSTKQQNSTRTENVDVVQGGDKKKKTTKGNPPSPPTNTKQSTTGKNETANKVNVNSSNKKQGIVMNSENQRGFADVEIEGDQEDDGQWLTQGSKQVNNRNRNKGKAETSNGNNQELSPTSTSSNRKTTSDKRTGPTSSNNDISSSTNKTDINVDLAEPTSHSAAPITPTTTTPEPIEVCQLLPAGEDRYTANDNWWKQALNKQQTFSINDIGEWPEREQDEQYTIQKRLIPVKAKALTEKDINVDKNDEINSYKNGREDEKLNFNNQTISSSVVAGEGKTSTSQSKKRSTNVRRLS